MVISLSRGERTQLALDAAQQQTHHHLAVSYATHTEWCMIPEGVCVCVPAQQELVELSDVLLVPCARARWQVRAVYLA